MSEYTRQLRYEISEHQLSIVTACMLFLLFFAFIAGYFWGQRVPTESQGLYLQYDTEPELIVQQENGDASPVYTLEVARMLSESAARSVIDLLGRNGIKAEIQNIESYAFDGQRHRWYQIILGPLSKRELVGQKLVVRKILAYGQYRTR